MRPPISRYVRALAIFSLVCLAGCLYPTRKRVDSILERTKELDRAPFAMPSKFPVPEDAVALSRPLKGGTVTFETHQTIRELAVFYDGKMLPLGLYSDKALRVES